MAEKTKLSVSKALEKMRAEPPKSKMQRRDEETDALEEEIRRLRAARRRVQRDQRAGSIKRG